MFEHDFTRPSELLHSRHAADSPPTEDEISRAARIKALMSRGAGSDGQDRSADKEQADVSG